MNEALTVNLEKSSDLVQKICLGKKTHKGKVVEVRLPFLGSRGSNSLLVENSTVGAMMDNLWTPGI